MSELLLGTRRACLAAKPLDVGSDVHQPGSGQDAARKPMLVRLVEALRRR